MKILVYAGSGTTVDKKFFDAARELGTEIAKRGHTLINGAGNMGLMAASADACMAAGGKAIGVIPQFMVDEGWCHEGMTHVETVSTMHERKARMMELADAVIALPGGPGTLEELAENMTWKQLGLFGGPTVLMNVDGYYEPLVEMIGRMVGYRFMRPECTSLCIVANNAVDALDLCENTPQWNLTKRGQALY